jgi:hypothetical protein
MLPLISTGIWVVLVTLGAVYGGAYWRSHVKPAADVEHETKLAVRALKVLTVPIIENGVLRGYISASFSIVAPSADPHGDGLDPESFIRDEAFRMIYADKNIDYTKPGKQDLAELTRQIVERVNARIGKTAVREILISNFNFVAREDVPK